MGTHTSEESDRARQRQHCEDHDCAKSQPVGGHRVVLQSVPLKQEVVAFLQEIKLISKKNHFTRTFIIKSSLIEMK